ncbi:MAG: type 1 glutamine amidotransferase [Timaviella obliquedivisa GSE-PSE-MK23-08B]|jgi:protease I|nr:type 1 glutamine amidotransferase [Timaviella obliquedivisa GSE-PSE-MK23-08B]
MADLSNIRVAVLVSDGFEEAELTEPVRALKESGATVKILSPTMKPIQGFRHHEKGALIQPDGTLDGISADAYDAVLLPGGALNADNLRVNEDVKRFLKEFQTSDKPIAAICHAQWELISAGIVEGRNLTSYHSIQDDIVNAGGNWLDQEVVIDKNWVTSRQPQDIPAFNHEMLTLFSQYVPAIAGGGLA